MQVPTSDEVVAAPTPGVVETEATTRRFPSLMRHGCAGAVVRKPGPDLAIEHIGGRPVAQAPPRRRVQPSRKRLQAVG